MYVNTFKILKIMFYLVLFLIIGNFFIVYIKVGVSTHGVNIFNHYIDWHRFFVFEV